MQDFEKLGVFYLGKEYDLAAGKAKDELLLYDAKDLTTHAVCVGMTGSGKTGLCLSLLEEAAIDGIPAIVIDPKGDISNLLLTFPGLTASEFRPWIDESEAARKGMTPDEYAASTAKLWKQGLASWGQDGERIKKFRDAVDLTIYTPGSSAGVPLTILKSFDAPPAAVLEDADAFRGRISSAVSGLLALLGINADPVQSREHILLSLVFDTSWSKGRNIDLPSLIFAIQSPPFHKVGIMELDQFFPEKDRLSLAMSLNNLLASPSFSSWMEGEPLDINRLLHTPAGKPRISILSINHLSDAERMFFVTVLLNEVVSWIRTQSGTSSLRAILYMDEVFGYFPPSANPPSKTPMLTLLKQARAFGLGCVLATQNPVDLDYKGLSNTGTWFLGRLQTERDKMRVLEGLEGAAASTGSNFRRDEMEQILAGLGSRAFLMNNVHEDQPVVFSTRWALSYLRGPLTRNHIQTLMSEKKTQETAAVAEATPAAAAIRQTVEGVPTAVEQAPERLTIPAGVSERYVEVTGRVGESDRMIYRPALFAEGRLHYSKSTYQIDDWETRQFLIRMDGGVPDDVWDESVRLEEELELTAEPAAESEFSELPPELQVTKSYTAWEKEFKSFLYRTQDLIVYYCPELKTYSSGTESEGDFRVRLKQSAAERRDIETEKLRSKYASKFEVLRNRIKRAEDKVDVQTEQYKQKRMGTFISFGSSLLGAVLGRKLVSSTNVTRASSSMRSLVSTGREKGDIARAEEDLEILEEKFKQLEAEFQEQVGLLEGKLDVDSLAIEAREVSPRKTDISVEDFGLIWLPFRVDSSGIAEPVY